MVARGGGIKAGSIFSERGTRPFQTSVVDINSRAVSAGLIGGRSTSDINSSAVAGYKSTSTVDISSFATGAYKPRSDCEIDSLAVSSGQTSQNYPNGYAYRRTLVIPFEHSLGGPLTNYPFRFAFPTMPHLRSVANGGKVAGDNGWDIIYTLADSTALDHDAREYNPTTGGFEHFIRIPTFSATEQTVIYQYYGKGGLAAPTENKAGVWVDYIAIWNARTGVDYTGQGRTLTPSNVGFGTILAEAGDYDGVSSRSVGGNASWMNGLSSLTVEMFILADSIGHDGGIWSIFSAGTPAAASFIRYDAVGTGGAVNTIRAVLNTSAGITAIEAPANIQTASAYQQIAVRWTSGAAPGMIIDGVQVTPSNTPAVLTGTIAIPADGVNTLGKNDAGNVFFPGLIDEVRISARRVSLGQLQATNFNYLFQPQFVGYGEEDTISKANQSPVAVPMVSTLNLTAPTDFVDMDLLARAYDPDAGQTLSLGAYSNVSRGSVSTVGGKARAVPGGNTSGIMDFDFVVTDGVQPNSGKGQVYVTATTVTPGTLPSDFPPIFDFTTGTGATIVEVNSQATLQSAIDNAPAGNRRIRCAPGVNYLGITINRPTDRNIMIFCETPPFDRLITDRATLDSQNVRKTGLNDTTGSNIIVVNPRPSNQTARIGIISLTQCGTLWIEGLWFNVDARIGAGGSALAHDVWIKKCRFSSVNANQVLIGNATNPVQRVIAWSNWHWADGTLDAGSGPNPALHRTDYGYQLYGAGLYMYNCYIEGGYGHMISMKSSAKPTIIDNTVFALWSDKLSSPQWQIIQNGQDGSPADDDRTGLFMTVRNCTFCDWTHPTGGVNGGKPMHCIRCQDTTGGLFHDNLFYANCTNPVYFRTGSAQQVLIDNGNPAPDIGVKAGSVGFTFRNNLLRGRSQPWLSTMYLAPAGGYTITFANNTVPNPPIPVTAKANGVTTVHNTGSGFSG